MQEETRGLISNILSLYIIANLCRVIFFKDASGRHRASAMAKVDQWAYVMILLTFRSLGGALTATHEASTGDKKSANAVVDDVDLRQRVVTGDVLGPLAAADDVEGLFGAVRSDDDDVVDDYGGGQDETGETAEIAKRPRSFRGDLGKRTPELADVTAYDDDESEDGSPTAERRAKVNRFRGDLGKRRASDQSKFRGDLGKRRSLGQSKFRGDLGKRRPAGPNKFRGDLGKRRPANSNRFRGDLGKRKWDANEHFEFLRQTPEEDDDVRYRRFEVKTVSFIMLHIVVLLPE